MAFSRLNMIAARLGNGDSTFQEMIL